MTQPKTVLAYLRNEKAKAEAKEQSGEHFTVKVRLNCEN